MSNPYDDGDASAVHTPTHSLKSGVLSFNQMVKDSDIGMLGNAMTALNLLTGVVVCLYSGLYYMLTQAGYCHLWCDTGVMLADGGCCTVPEGDWSIPVNKGKCNTAVSFTGEFSAFVISFYMMFFGGILVCFQLTMLGKFEAIRNFLVRYFGFVYFYKRRTHYLMFIGVMCVGNINSIGQWGAPVVGGVLALLTAVMSFVVRRQHPEIDNAAHDHVGSSNDGSAGGGGGDGEIDFNTTNDRSTTEGNFYGDDEAGTAI